MIKVSDQFKKIVSNIGKSIQTSEISEMSKLSKQEFYLLLLFCIDYNEKFENPDVVKNNLKFYLNDLNELNEFMHTGKTDNEVLKELVTLTGDEIITIENLVDSNEQPIRNIFNK